MLQLGHVNHIEKQKLLMLLGRFREDRPLFRQKLTPSNPFPFPQNSPSL